MKLRFDPMQMKASKLSTEQGCNAIPYCTTPEYIWWNLLFASFTSLRAAAAVIIFGSTTATLRLRVMLFRHSAVEMESGRLLPVIPMRCRCIVDKYITVLSSVLFYWTIQIFLKKESRKNNLSKLFVAGHRSVQKWQHVQSPWIQGYTERSVFRFRL